jgi:hypothetical protein
VREPQDKMEPETTPKPDDTSYQQRLMGGPWMKFGLIVGVIGGGIGVLVALGAAIATHSLVGIVMTLVIAGVVFGVLALTLGPLFRASKLLQTGIPAEAKILKVRDTGTTVNEQPEIELLLEVQPKSGGKWGHPSEGCPHFRAAWYIPGARVGVKVDPKNPNRVVITDRLDVPSRAGDAAETEAPDQAKAMALATAGMSDRSDSSDESDIP